MNKYALNGMKGGAILSGLLAVSAIVAAHPSALARSQTVLAIDPRDSLCYLETTDGRVVNLNRICGVGGSRPSSTLSALDRQFLLEYQAVLNRRHGRSAAAKNALSQAQNNPQAVVKRARDTCANIQKGISPDLAAIGQGGVEAPVIKDLALHHYCPDFDD
jgi:hypothetical protein